MCNNVYSLYNKLSCRYGDVVSFPSDGYALARVMENPNLKSHINEFELCRIGSVSVETGVITPCGVVRIAFPDIPEKLPVNESNPADESK